MPTTFASSINLETVKTREQWLKLAVAELGVGLDSILGAGSEARLKDVRVSVGCAPGQRTGSKTCRLQKSRDGWGAIFVPPHLDNEHEVLAFLFHQVMHVAADAPEHNAKFKAACAKVGLWDGSSPDSDLLTVFDDSLEAIGPNWNDLHSAIDLEIARAPKNTAKTYALKLQCPACKVNTRMAQTNIDIAGMPICGGKNGTLHTATEYVLA